MTGLRVGFLHLGGERHGVERYGRVLAAGAAARGDIEVVEHEVRWSGDDTNDIGRIEGAAQRFSSCDVAHVQFNRRVWGRGFRPLARARRFLARCSAPVVATLHDVYPRDPWAGQDRDAKRTRLERVRRAARALLDRIPANLAVRHLLARAAAVIVSSEEERVRLVGFPAHEKLRVIEHFVEPRPPLPDADAAKAALGLAGRRIVTILGFIHPRKGHDLAIEALALLPRDVTLVFAGAPSPGNDKKVRAMEQRARELKCADRLRITGWLDDAALDQHLAATDLGLCPFRFFSASGSLSTWISTGRPILCHALPQIDEYRRVAAGAFDTFAPFAADALASAIAAAFERHGAGATDPAIAALRERLALDTIVERHVAVWRAAAARTPR